MGSTPNSRIFGLCADRNADGKLLTARRLLAPRTKPSPPSSPDLESSTPWPWWERFLEQTGIDVMPCPSCGNGCMIRQPILYTGMALPLQEKLIAIPAT